MILVASPQDAGIINIARGQSQNENVIYGGVFVIGVDQLPLLGPNENLFIIGHAVAGARAELGDENGDFAVDGIELFDNLRPIFPPGYAADVFIDACESANWGRGNFSLIETFKSQIGVVFDGVRVFGRLGEVAGNIPHPDDGVWRQAF